jgi:hypothetical protein
VNSLCCFWSIWYAAGVDLGMEYTYWSFIEAYPAHTALSVNAKVEAMDVLTWAWTGESIVVTGTEHRDPHAYQDRLLPSQRTVPVHSRGMPGLMSLFRPFSNGEIMNSCCKFVGLILFQSKTTQDSKPSSKLASFPGSF